VKPILTTATAPQGREVTLGEAQLHHPAPECEGEIAARESLEPEGPVTARLIVERAASGAQNGLTAGRDPHRCTPQVIREECRNDTEAAGS
jgi:hypothetical protein